LEGVEGPICGNCKQSLSIHQIALSSALGDDGGMRTYYRTGGCQWSECLSTRDIIKTMAEHALKQEGQWDEVIGGKEFIEICKWLLLQMETIEIIRGDQVMSEIIEKELEDHPPGTQLIEKFRRFIAKAKAGEEDILTCVNGEGAHVASVQVKMMEPMVVCPGGAVDGDVEWMGR